MATISIISIVKDHAAGLRETFESVRNQDCIDWELIIVMAPSSDNTATVAHNLQLADSRIRIVEQRSIGIYGAMNEGLESARGEFIWFMNAGDKFASPFVLSHATQEISRGTFGMVIGGYQIDKGKKDQIYSYPDGRLTVKGFAFTRRGGCHQAMIFKTQLLKNLGGFDTSYSLASDFDLVLKVIKSEGARRVAFVYASIEPGGRADQGIFQVHDQKHQIRRNLLGGPFVHIASLLWTFMARAKIKTRTWLKGIKMVVHQRG